MFARDSDPNDPAEAQREGRIWACNLQAPIGPDLGNPKMLFEQSNPEGLLLVEHPIPSQNSLKVQFIVKSQRPDSPSGLYRVDVLDGSSQILATATGSHDNVSADGTLCVIDTNGVAGDTAPPVLPPPSGSKISDVSLVNPVNGAQVFLFRVTMNEHPYHAHPHISPDKQWVIFNDFDNQRVVAVKLFTAKVARVLGL